MIVTVQSGDHALVSAPEPFIARVLWSDDHDALVQHRLADGRMCRRLVSTSDVLAVGGARYLLEMQAAAVRATP